MVDPTTTNIQLAVPTRGSDVGTWDVPVNGDMTILDGCFGNVTAKSLSNLNVTLTVTEAQASVLRFSGILSGNVQVTLPAIYKFWTVENLCTGAFTLQLTTGASTVGLPPGNPVDVYADSAGNIKFRNLAPVGSFLDIYTSSIPGWIGASSVPPYLTCDGSTFSSSTYPALAAFLGSTTLPDLRGRVRAYLDNMGGSAASRLTSTTISPNANTVGGAGGQQTNTIAQANLPAATLPLSGTPANIAGSGGSYLVDASSSFVASVSPGSTVTIYQGLSKPAYTPQGTVSLGGSGVALPSVQPTLISGITMIRAA